MRFWLPAACLPLLPLAGSFHAFGQPHLNKGNKAVVRLASEQLQVEVMDPCDPERYNRGVRFSPVANVLRAVMDGKEFLFAPVEHDPETENGGLAMEFDIMPPDGPPGFAEAAEGEGFLKIGVGVLKKSGKRYDFFKTYEAVDLAQTDVEWSADRAVFHQVCQGTNGYAYRLDAEVRVGGNVIQIRCKLRNTGTRFFATEQYAHNFFRFDGLPVGPGYEVEFPYDFEAAKLEPVLEKSGRKLVFSTEIPKEIKAVNARVFPKAEGATSDSLIVRQVAAGMQIRSKVSRSVSHIDVHAIPNYLCPEQFVRIDLQPGEIAEWVREYRFELATGRSPDIKVHQSP